MAVDYSAFRSSAEDDAQYDVEPFNHKAARSLLVARIERAVKQLNGELKSGQKDFTVGHNNQLRYRPTISGHHIAVDSSDEDYFPIKSDQFENFAKVFIDQVNAGEYDGQLQAIIETASKGDAPVKARRTRTAGGALKPAPVGYNAIRRSVGTSVGRFKKSVAEVKADLLARGADKADVEKAIKALNG